MSKEKKSVICISLRDAPNWFVYMHKPIMIGPEDSWKRALDEGMQVDYRVFPDEDGFMKYFAEQLAEYFAKKHG